MAKHEDKVHRLLERWSLQPEDLDLGPQVLGAGAFGEVRTGTLRDGNSSIEVAVKLLPMNGNCQKTWLKIASEAVLLAKVSERCKRTSRLYGICLKDDKFCLVMKKYVTSLENRINKYPDRKAPRKLLEQWSLDICEAVVELHAQNVVIRDLKPSNVLVDEFDGAILADFGISKMVGSTLSQRRMSTAVAGTFAYMAPEMFTTTNMSFKVDVWALGCLLLELYVGKVPWEGLEMANIMYKVVSLKEHPPIPSDMNRDLADVLEQCLVHDPVERASAMTTLEVLKKAYFQAPGNLSNIQEDYLSRIANLEREVEAVTLLKDGAESQLFALEEEAAMLKVVNEDGMKEKALLEQQLAQAERRIAQLLMQEIVVNELQQALKDSQDQVFVASVNLQRDLNNATELVSKISSLEGILRTSNEALEEVTKSNMKLTYRNIFLEQVVAFEETKYQLQTIVD